ncbi:MAG: GldM family protein [Bacteroidota bacterium]
MSLKYKISLFLLLMHTVGFAQKLRVYQPFDNVVMPFIENEIRIEYEGIKAEEMIVKGSVNCIIKHIEGFNYTVKLIEAIIKEKSEIYIGVKNGNQINWLDTMPLTTYKARHKYHVKLGNIESGFQAVKDLLKQDSLIFYDECGSVTNIRVVKFNLLIVRKNGPLFQESSEKGAQLSAEMKTAIAQCKGGDIILFDRIRGKGPGGERTLNPMIITVTENLPPFNNFEFRTAGYYRDSGLLKPYFFPLAKDQKPFYYFENLYIKDSVWTFWQYSPRNDQFNLHSRDSYKNNRLIRSVYYMDTLPIIHYELIPLTDSTFYYTSFHPNGAVYQKGILRNDTKYTNIRKYFFAERYGYSEKKESWEMCLKETPDQLFPIGSWKQFDSKNNLQSEVTYSLIQDTLIYCMDDPIDPFSYLYKKNYFIVTDGPYIRYAKGKIIETILFKNGIIVNRFPQKKQRKK